MSLRGSRAQTHYVCLQACSTVMINYRPGDMCSSQDWRLGGGVCAHTHWSWRGCQLFVSHVGQERLLPERLRQGWEQLRAAEFCLPNVMRGGNVSPGVYHRPMWAEAGHGGPSALTRRTSCTGRRTPVNPSSSSACPGASGGPACCSCRQQRWCFTRITIRRRNTMLGTHWGHLTGQMFNELLIQINRWLVEEDASSPLC